MNKRIWVGLVVASSLVACATTARPTGHDSGPVGVDTGPIAVDAGHDAGAAVDAFVPRTDAFVPPVDAGPGHDAFVPPVDAGPGIDAFVPPTDSGAVDAGRDTGTAVDAARDTGVDAFVPPTDTGTGMIVCSTAAACIGHLVISEVAARGSASALDEFVEVQNTGTVPIDISGVELAYYSSTGTEAHRATAQAGLVIPPGRFALFASMTFADATPDVTERWTTGLADAAGTVELRVGTTAVDRFGWGTGATIFEGATYTPAISSGTASYERKANATSTATSMATGGADALAGNRYDTDHNSTDFITRAVRQPQTLASPAE